MPELGLWPRGGLWRHGDFLRFWSAQTISTGRSAAAPQSNPVPFLVVSFVLASFGGIVFNITGISFQQAVMPDRMLGRLNATRRSSFLPLLLSPVPSIGRMADAVREHGHEAVTVGDA